MSFIYCCDNDINCIDGLDEKDCICLKEELLCFLGGCVLFGKLCNGLDDCLDGRDECFCGKSILKFRLCLVVVCYLCIFKVLVLYIL